MISPMIPRCRYRVDPLRSYELAVAENPLNAPGGSGNRRKRSLGVASKFWKPGRTLWVSFLGAPDRRLKMSIFELASQWLDLSGANLEIDLAEDDDKKATIRILTGPHLPHSLSDIGTDALAYGEDTMCINVPLGHDFSKTPYCMSSVMPSAPNMNIDTLMQTSPGTSRWFCRATWQPAGPRLTSGNKS